jgi:hypothetical protein
MKWRDGSGPSLVFVAAVAALAISPGPAVADFTFGHPVNLGPVVNNPSDDCMNCISADGLEIYIGCNRPGGFGSWDIWVTTRVTTDEDWGTPMNLGSPVNTGWGDAAAAISSDELTVYFDSDRPGGFGSWDLWVTTRATKADKWGIPVNLGPTFNYSGSTLTGHPDISADGLTLYFGSDRPGGYGGGDIWVTTRETTDDSWGGPVNLGPTVNSTNAEADSSISSDGLLLFFGRPASASGRDDIWVTRRASVSDPWGLPVNVGPPVNTSADDWAPNVSADGRTLYFSSNRAGGYGGHDIWQAPIIPIVDFNGDGRVDLQDLLRLIESWGKDDPSVDIGPMPWGDGKVDEKDLEVLMSYWGQELNDPRLAASWRLDETAGLVAVDRVGENDGTLHGGPIWQPEGGKTGGALLLDGLDDYVSTAFVLDPAARPFSILAWVRGGAPGQVIVSQIKGVNWLMAGASDGGLTTELKTSGRTGKALESAASVTDGAWHRVGFVWDATNRILYVDDVEVARDTQTGLAASAGGLYIGAGGTLTPGTFWTGLIDDVRIYDRAVKP